LRNMLCAGLKINNQLLRTAFPYAGKAVFL